MSSSGNEVVFTLRTEDEASAGFKKIGDEQVAIVNRVTAAVKDGAADQDEALALLMAQWNQTGDAVRAVGGDVSHLSGELREAATSAEHMGQTVRTELIPLPSLAEQLEAAFRGVTDQVEAGSTQAAKSLGTMRLQLDELRDNLVATQKAGGPVSDADLRAIDAAEDQYGQLVRRYSQVKAARADVADDVKAAQAVTAGEIQSIGSLNDLLALGGAKWAGYGAKMAGAMGAFSVGFEMGDKLRGGLNALFREIGLGNKAFDEWVQSALRMERVSGAIVSAVSEELDQQREYQNQVEILTRLNIEHAGTVEDVAAKYDQLTEKRRREIAETRRLSEAYDETRAALQGIDPEELEKRGERLAATWEQFKKSGESLDTFLQKMPGFAAEIGKTVEQMEALGVSSQDTVGPGLNKVAVALGQFERGKASIDVLKASIDELDKVVAKHGATYGSSFKKGADEARQALLSAISGDGSINAAQAAIKELSDTAAAADGPFRKGLLDPLLAARNELPAVAAGLDQATNAMRSLGVSTKEDIEKGITAVLAYKTAVENAGPASADQIARIREELRKYREEIELLPEAQRRSFDQEKRILDEHERRYASMSEVALDTFGVQTPQAIEKSVQALDGLTKAWGPPGEATQEQAERIVEESKKILGAMALLPKGQREASAGVEVHLREMVKSYGDAADKQASFVEGTLEAEKKAMEERKRLLEEFKQQQEDIADSFASSLERLVASAEAETQKLREAGPGKNLGELQEELAGLEIKGLLSPEEQARMDELKDQIAATTMEVKAFERHFRDAGAVTADVDREVVGLTRDLKENSNVWGALSQDQRASVAEQMERIQALGELGGATSQSMQREFGHLRDIFEQTGVPLGALGDKLDQLAGGSSGAEEAIASLRETTAETAKGLDELGTSAEEAVQNQETLAERVKLASEKQKKAFEDMMTPFELYLSKWIDLEAVIDRCNLKSNLLKECWASTSIG